jgi:hypothetical protein
MTESYKVASIVVIAVSLINLVTTVMVLSREDIDPKDESYTTLIGAPAEVLKLTITGIFGFITGSAVEAYAAGKKRKEEELAQRIAELENENAQLRELNEL